MLARTLLCVGLLLAVSPDARAQERAEDYADSHLQAAMDLLILSDTEELMDRSVEEMLRVQLEQDPSLLPFEDVMRGFFADYLSWKALRD